MGRTKRDNDNGFELWGGYMNAKIAKLEEQFLEQVEREEIKTSDIFNGVSIFVNGYTKPSSNELKILMAEHGGIYHHYFKSGHTKFIVASNLPDTKIKNLPTTKIVKPEWVSESIKAGSLLDYKDFLLHSNHSKTQPRLKFQNSEPTSDKSVKASFSEEINKTLLSCNLTADNSEIVRCRKPLDVKISVDEKVTPSLESRVQNDETTLLLSNTECSHKSIISPKETNFTVEETILTPDRTSIALVSPDRDKVAFARTAVDPRFLSEYYNNSRLHHISQLGAAFKQYINELRDSSNNTFPLRESLRSTSLKRIPSCQNIRSGKVIMHIDMDCFFVSVGLRRHPQLKGQPVAVTHAKGGGTKQHIREGVDRKAEFNLYKAKRKNNMQKNLGNEYLKNLEKKFTTRIDDVANENEKYGSMSEIASCSYEARALGVYNGMFMGPALRLCPNLKTIPYDFEAYKEVAFTLYNTVAQYTLDIEAVSCDEMYVDCTDLLCDTGLTPVEFAKNIRQEIKLKTGCPCSTGFGSNKLQARLATKKAKPDGQYHLVEDEVLSFFSEIPLGDLPGVGRQMQNKLTALGYTNCASLRTLELVELQKHFGNKTGLLLFNYCRGQDEKPLNFTTLRKSISAGVNYGIRFEDFSQCETFLKQLCQEVCSRMSQHKVLGKSLTFKLMVRAADAPKETAKFMGHGFCDNVTKTTNFSHSTDNLDVISKEVVDICKKIKVKPEDMRGITIQISKLESSEKNKIEEKNGGMQNFLRSKTKLLNPLITAIDDKKDKLPSSKTEVAVSSEINKLVNSSELKKNYNSVATTKAEFVSCFPKRCNIEVKPLTPKLNVIPSFGAENKPLEKKVKSLGLTGKRRGRPPKSASLQNNEKVKNQTLNIFLTSNNNQGRSRNQKYKFEDLDQDFLNALPDELKSEILANCKTPEFASKHKSKIDLSAKTNEIIPIDPEYLAALPDDIRKEIESNISEYSNPYLEEKPKHSNSVSKTLIGKSEDCPLPGTSDEVVSSEVEIAKNDEIDTNEDLLQLSWKDVRQMLRDWFASTKSPLQCDIHMICSFVRNLATKKQIEDLDCLLRFFYRAMCEEPLCRWHQIYLQTEASAQEAMLVVYGKKLKTSTKFSCCNP